MSDSPEAVFVHKCLLIIEKNLAWGDSRDWTNYDFEKLSDAIQENTSVRLSTTTLKRIWGKVKYENVPTIATLNTLARFAGFDDWRTFRLHDQDDQQLPALTAPHSSKGKFRKKWFYWIATLSVGALTIYFILGTIGSKKRSDPNDFSFKANKIFSEGVPNSVVFEYDAAAAQTDSVFIVQTWDIRRKTLVNKNGKNHSAIYYYPGYFNAKLIADGEIVKTHDLQITSNGWLGIAETDDKPFYFNKKDISRPRGAEIDSSLLAKNNFRLKPELTKIRLFNQGDMGDLMNDNFVFETTLKNDYTEGNNKCQFVEVLIQCKNDIIIIPLSAKACVGEIGLYAAGQQLVSKTNDLSGFGADLSQWTSLKVEAHNKLMNFYVNDQKAASLTFPNAPTGIVGVQYRFNGTGAVKDTWFENSSGRRNL